jgi:hypothetical protein
MPGRRFSKLRGGCGHSWAASRGHERVHAFGSGRGIPCDHSPVSAPSTSPLDQIRQLAELGDAGVLTEGEFGTKKAELLGRL